MFELLIGLIALPTIIMSVKFWVTMLQWGLTNKRDFPPCPSCPHGVRRCRRRGGMKRTAGLHAPSSLRSAGGQHRVSVLSNRFSRISRKEK